MASLRRERLIEILDRCAGLRVAVLGDYCLDVYWHADMRRSELSRETPHYPLPVVRETFAPGGAGNPPATLRALGIPAVYALAVFGDDWRGAILRAELERLGVDLGYARVAPGRVTPTYAKPVRHGYDSQQEDPRLDFQNYAPLPTEPETQLVDTLRQVMASVDALAVVDQLDHGIITDTVRAQVIALARRYPERVVVVDSRKRIGLYSDVIVKPNEIELASAVEGPAAAGRPTGTAALGPLGREMARRTGRPVVVTLGADGALVCTPEQAEHLPAAPVTPPLDIVGAGDAFLAVLTAALAAGASLVEAAAMANLGAAVVVEKLNQTGTASAAEILARYDLAFR